MPEPDPKLLEAILRLCAGTAPEPWYPSEHAKANGVDRDSLDGPLEKLRLGGLVQLTEWVQGKGQGYRLTPDGTAFLNDPRALHRLQGGELPQKAAASQAAPAGQGEKATAYERGEAVREAFLNPSVPFVAQALIAVNIVIFVLEQTVNPDGEIGRLLALGQYVSRRTIVQDQWWRMITSCFFHLGTAHLVMNMYALFVLGRMGERLWRSGRFAILYFLSGLGGSTGVLLFGKSDGGAAGASGAICGIFAAEGLWLMLNRAFLPPPVVAAWKRNMVFNLILITVISLVPGISTAGHAGGAVGGLIVALLLHIQRFGAPRQRLAALLGLLLFPGLCVGLVLWQMRTNEAWLTIRRHLESAYSSALLERSDQMTRATLRATLETIQPIIAKPPAERDPAAVQGAQANLAELAAEVQLRLRETTKEGPYWNEISEMRRQRAAELLGESLELCRLDEAALGGGGNWQTDKEAVEKAFDRLARLRLR